MAKLPKNKEKKQYFIPMELQEGTIISKEYEYAQRCWSKIGNRVVRTILIPSTREQYEAYMRPLWQEDKREQRLAEKRKKREKAQKEHRIDKSIQGVDTAVSYERLVEMEYGFHSEFNLEEKAEKKELIAALHHELATLQEIDRIILVMISDGFSEAAVGKFVGLSQKGVNKRKHKLYKLLKDHLKDYR